MNGDEAQSNPLPPGFDDVEPLGVTGCGQIYRARVATVDGYVEQVAVTLVDTPVRGRDARRLRSDCLGAVAINAEPGVLAVRDLGFTKDHRPFLVTDTILPGTLTTRIEQQGPLPVGEVVALGLTLARALQAAHRNGILHLGVAPDVVFLTPEGPALGHFGLAWAVRPPSQPDVPATAIVHAPRELFGWAGPSVGSDVYGLASVLRTGLTGRAPFETEARTGRAALYHRLVQGAPPKLQHPGVPGQLATLLDRMMDPDAARRPGLDEVMRTLEEVAQVPGLMAARAGVGAAMPGPAPTPMPTPMPTPTPTTMPPPQQARGLMPPAALVARGLVPEAEAVPVVPTQEVVGHQVRDLSFTQEAKSLSSQTLPMPVAQPLVTPPPEHGVPPFAQPAQPNEFPIPRPAPPAVSATTPKAQPVEPRRRNTGLVLLVAAGATALAAGVAWGVATAPKKAAQAQDAGPVVSVAPFSGAKLSEYQVTDAKAGASGTDVTVTWSAPRVTAGVQSYIVVVNLHNQSVQSTTVAGQTLTASFKGLTPATTYCVSVVTFAVAPGDSGPHTAPPDQCALVTTGGGSDPGSGGGTSPTHSV